MAYFITESCIGCTACSRVCPVDAIAGAARQRHTVNIRRCVSCGTCGSVCPKQAILDGHGKPCHAVPRAKWPKPKVNPVLCSACGICTVQCRFDCMRISDPAFHGDIHVHAELSDPVKCVGCGLCARACPLHAIEMEVLEA